MTEKNKLLRYVYLLLLVPVLFIVAFAGSNKQGQHILHSKADTIPAMFLGDFKDDYYITCSISDSLFTQHPGVKYHILRWNIKEQYFIARNDAHNPGEQGLYSRIDFMEFNKMAPFLWGFCLTVYNAPNDSLAEATAIADRQNPRKGCGGYPFSRMKRIE